MKKTLLWIVILVAGINLTYGQDTTVTHHAPFRTDNQSLWRQGATGIVDIDIPFFDLGWNESGSFGGITYVAGFPFGAQFSAGTWGEIGSGLRIEFGNERVDIDYVTDISLDMPASGTFEKGQEITINTSHAPIADSCSISPDEYNLVLQVWLALGFGFDIGGQFCFFDCTNATIIDIDMPVDTFDIVYVSNTTGISLLDGMYEWPVGDYFPFTWQDSREIIDLMIDLPTNAGAGTTLVGQQLISKIPPYKYASVYFDIPKFIGALNIPYVSAFFANLHNEWELGPITIGYILMDMGFELALYHNQTLTFTPNIKTTMTFPGNVDYKILNPSNALLSSGTSSNITFDVGNKLRFRYPCNYDFMHIDPYYNMRNNFRNKTYDSIAFDFIFQMLEFHISMDDIEVIPEICIPIYEPCGPWYCVVCDWCHVDDWCTPAVVFHGFNYTFGPLVDLQPNLFNVKYNWVDNNWEMLGFNDVDPGIFTLKPARFDVIVNPTAAPCFGLSGGSATATVTHGTPPYRYEWSNGVSFLTTATSHTVNNLPAGTHYVIVTDANNCVTFSSFEITQPAAALSMTSTLTHVDCAGNSTGMIDISVSGGTSPYSYSWSNGSTTQDISGIPAGNYSVTVSDLNACTLISTFSITQPAALVSVPSSIHVLCYGDSSGSAAVSTTGGTSPYTYLWSDGSSTPDISHLPAGNYSVTVSDYNGCQNILNYTINQPAAPLNLSISTQNAYCNGESSGSITVVASGGTAPYSYSWFSGTQTLNHNAANIGSIGAGTYTVVVTDAHGCSESQQILITEPPAISITLSTTDNLCFGEFNGAIDLTVTGGSGAYTFTWSNGAGSEDLVSLPAGNYQVTITDANGCTNTASAYITEPGAPLTASVEPNHVLCFGNSTGSANLSVSGGTAPYAYLWSDGSTQQNPTGLIAGTYTVTITDNNGCVAYSGTVIGQPADSLALQIVITDPTCYGYQDGSIVVNASGGTTPYYLRWDDTDYLMQNNGHSVGLLESGYYQVIVTDANGCKNERLLYIDQPDSISVSAISAITNCFGGNDGSIDLTTWGGTPPYAYAWSTGATSQDVIGLESGYYQVTVSDQQGCEKSTVYFVGTMPQIIISSTVVPVSCIDNTDGSVMVSISGGASPYSYLWSNGATDAVQSNLPPGDYSVTVTDGNGCVMQQTYVVVESSTECISIPSSFTPNGDGVNDIWVIRNIDLYPGHVVKIFNRWGNQLYEASPYSPEWNGNYNGKPLPAETYYYVIDLNNGQPVFTGTITIIR